MATKKTDTIAGKTIQLGLDHSVTIEAVRGRKVTGSLFATIAATTAGPPFSYLPSRSVTLLIAKKVRPRSGKCSA